MGYEVLGSHGGEAKALFVRAQVFPGSCWVPHRIAEGPVAGEGFLQPLDGEELQSVSKAQTFTQTWLHFWL